MQFIILFMSKNMYFLIISIKIMDFYVSKTNMNLHF